MLYLVSLHMILLLTLGSVIYMDIQLIDISCPPRRVVEVEEVEASCQAQLLCWRCQTGKLISLFLYIFITFFVLLNVTHHTMIHIHFCIPCFFVSQDYCSAGIIVPRKRCPC